MKKFITVAGLCCLLSLIIIGVIWFAPSDKSNTDKPQAKGKASAIKVGNLFPDFSVTEVDGRTITDSSLKGKPAIVWFTTSWCIPCQIGAREVANLDNELGGKAFDVLVIFVDLRETDDDLRNWRKKFANEDWMVAFDNDQTKLSPRIQLQFLDSKFVLDKMGIIKNIDFKIVDESYLNSIEKIIQENS